MSGSPVTSEPGRHAVVLPLHVRELVAVQNIIVGPGPRRAGGLLDSYRVARAEHVQEAQRQIRRRRSCDSRKGRPHLERAPRRRGRARSLQLQKVLARVAGHAEGRGVVRGRPEQDQSPRRPDDGLQGRRPPGPVRPEARDARERADLGVEGGPRRRAAQRGGPQQGREALARRRPVADLRVVALRRAPAAAARAAAVHRVDDVRQRGATGSSRIFDGGALHQIPAARDDRFPYSRLARPLARGARPVGGDLVREPHAGEVVPRPRTISDRALDHGPAVVGPVAHAVALAPSPYGRRRPALGAEPPAPGLLREPDAGEVEPAAAEGAF